MLHGGLRVCHRAARIVFELPGSNARSIAPVFSSWNRIFCQLFPPSLERKTPRSAFGPYACPSAATNTLFLSLANRKSVSRFSPRRPFSTRRRPHSQNKKLPASRALPSPPASALRGKAQSAAIAAPEIILDPPALLVPARQKAQQKPAIQTTKTRTQ